MARDRRRIHHGHFSLLDASQRQGRWSISNRRNADRGHGRTPGFDQRHHAKDARRAGATSLEALLARLGAVDRVWRVDFVFVGPDDRPARRADTSPDELAAVMSRLSRLDRNGAWAHKTLQLIGRYPGIVSTTLAQHVDQDRPTFKLNVRKLKELGLTESLQVGYRLSPRGEAVLRALG